MKINNLGNSNLQIHPIGMGCWAYGSGDYWGEQNQKDVNDVVAKAIDLGINFFDTAEMYNNGASEESLGIALKGKRDKAIICTKVSPSNASPQIMRKHCEASLKRLGLEYVDIYMLHWPINAASIEHFTNNSEIIDNPPTVEGAFHTLMELQKEGKIRYIGISNFGVKQMQEALTTGAEIIVNEMPYNILSRAIEKEILPFCIKNNIGIISSMALQQGLLAGIYKSAEDVPPHQAHSRHFSYKRGGNVSRHGEHGAETEIFDALKQIKGIANEMGIHIAQLSIAWILAKQGIQCALVGSRNTRELKTNIAAGSMKLDSKIIKKIDDISKPVLEKLGFNPDYYENSLNSRIK